ncbi:MAG: exo-alpha-sialidase [Propionibacterium sp.]|nr:exo-alpha-sialidase [Propionibacterium sp.]
METTEFIIATTGEPFDGAPSDEPCYRIPALAVTASGRVVLAYDVRTSPLDLPGPNGIAYRASDDAGRSWSEPRWLRRPEGEWGCGDPSLLALSDGTLLCWYVSSDGTSFWDDQSPGGDWMLWVARSADGGETWVHADVTGFVWPDDAGSLFASSGNGIVLASGRILQPIVVRRRGTQHRYCAMAISDDDGVTWRLGAPVSGCDETKVAQLPDGTVVLHSRATPSRLVAESRDGGETFTAPRADVPEPGCNGGLTTLADGRLACTVVHPDGGEPIEADLPDPTGGRGATSGPDWSSRRNLVLRTGLPGAWGEPVVIDPGLAAYSVAITLPDGAVAVAWEYGAYEGIKFARVTPADT